MTHILESIEADIRQRKARAAQQMAITANDRARAQKWAALIANPTKEPRHDPHAIPR